MGLVNRLLVTSDLKSRRIILKLQREFVAAMREIDGPAPGANATYFLDQFELMAEGVRDGRISDSALAAWERVGLRLYAEDPALGLVPTRLGA